MSTSHETTGTLHLKTRDIIWVLRLFVGLLFIFSGLIKANDPMGFSYKLADYYHEFGHFSLLQFFDNPIFYNTALASAILICVLEIFLGVALIMGVWRKWVVWVLLLMMIFFTFLTGFSSITNLVTDCGCFGDAIPLTPTQSFVKDIVLLLLIIALFIKQKYITRLGSAWAGRGLALGAGVLTILFALHVVNHLPVIDFRKYKVGNDLCKLNTEIRSPKTEIVLVYKNLQTGTDSTFTNEEYERRQIGHKPEKWEFVETRSEVVDPGEPAEIDFRVDDYDSGEDATAEVLNDAVPILWVICYNLDQTHTKKWDDINALQARCEQAGIMVYGLSASAPDSVEAFRHKVQAAFPFYVGDEVLLKTIVRSNPGLVLLNECKVAGKWGWRDVPDFEKVQGLVE